MAEALTVSDEGEGEPAPDNWRDWARTLFPAYTTKPFARRHQELWEWAYRVEPGETAPAFLAIWPRESAKSTSAQMVLVFLAGEKRRRYAWYVSETQSQANDHVTTLASMLTSSEVERFYPALAERALSKFGHAKAFRQTRLWTRHGFILDAVGLDVARRGVKLEEQRPDMIVFDDIDNEHDTPDTVDKKIRTITTKILPAGAEKLCVLVAQNLVHSGSVVSRLVTGQERFLHNRIVSGPFRVIDDLVTEHQDGRDIIIQGAATWEGQNLDYAQDKIDTVGLPAFISEYQNEVGDDSRTPFRVEWWDIESGRARYHPTESKDLFRRAERRMAFIDTSFKDNESNDPSVILFADLLPAALGYKAVVRDVVQERILSALLPDWIEEHVTRWNVDNKLQGVIIEDKGSGTTAIQSLRLASPQWLANIVGEFEPRGTKEYRAKQASIWCRRGMVLFPYPHPSNVEWYGPFINHVEPLGQLFLFPFAVHDDMVDALTSMVLYWEYWFDEGYRATIAAQRAAEQEQGHGRPTNGATTRAWERRTLRRHAARQ